MKKYHQSPTFGVKSGRSRWTPYVDARYSDEPPVRTFERYKNHAMLAEKTETYVAIEKDAVGGVLESLAFRSSQRRIRGGSKRAGYSERYEASPRVSIEVIGLPETAWVMA